MKPDGSIRYVHRRIVPLRDTGGNVIGGISTWEDVTDQVTRERNGRLNEAVLEMRGPQDVDEVLKAVYNGLKVLKIPFSYASVQIVEGDRFVSHYFLEDGT